MEPVRFGLVGYGFGGRWFHAPLLSAAAECDLVAVVTSSPERRALVEREHPGTATGGSLQELVAAGGEAVAISTPADTHSAVTDAATGAPLAYAFGADNQALGRPLLEGRGQQRAAGQIPGQLDPGIRGVHALAAGAARAREAPRELGRRNDQALIDSHVVHHAPHPGTPGKAVWTGDVTQRAGRRDRLSVAHRNHAPRQRPPGRGQ